MSRPPVTTTARSDDTQAGPDTNQISVLRKRGDFLRASKAQRVVKPGFILQARLRGALEADGVRVGYTCSKKVGNAVARNRAKRRLREIARLTLAPLARDGMDYVLIGRASTTAQLSFTRLQSDLRDALARVHRGRA
ncbi:MAG: ribonuclease P protein component [Pseudomonadota bacterium]